MSRRINAPGIEINEIDRSAYDQTVDNSTVGTATLMLGFADRGDDYTVHRINSINTFIRLYGNPTNTAEKYFYNAAYEVVNGGGVCYTAKLPYYNDSFGNFTYTSYTIDSEAQYIQSATDIVQNQVSCNGHNLFDMLFWPAKFTGGDLMNFISDYNEAYVMSHMQDFMQFVNNRTNFNIDEQNFLDDVLLSSSVEKRLAQYNLSAVMTYSASSDASVKARLSAYGEVISAIQGSLRDAFGQDATISDVVSTFTGGLYLHEFKTYFNEMSAKMNENGCDSPISGDSLSALDIEFTELKTVDDSLKTYATIQSDVSSRNEIMSYENYDKFLIKEMKVPRNKLYIVDRTRGKYEKDEFGNELVGLMPVVTTAANALFYQNIITKHDSILGTYNVVSKMRNSYRTASGTALTEVVKPLDKDDQEVFFYNNAKTMENFIGLGEYLGGEANVTINDFTVSENAAEHYPALKFIEGRLDRKYLSQVGIVVMKVFKDSANEGKLNFMPVESFVGSLDRTARDVDTGGVTFIDDVVNNNSDYINVFSNANIPENADSNPTGLKNTGVFAIRNQTACSLGFYERDTRKNIHVTESIYKPMLKVFERYEDRNVLDFDIMVDAGVSNIAQFVASTQLYARDSDNKPTSTYVKDEFQRYGVFDFNDDNAHFFKMESSNQLNVWRKVLLRFDEFAKNTRKDFIFLADGPRPFCVEGNAKAVRPSKPDRTVKNTILPKMKYVANVVNSSYSAGYLNWFWSMDHSTGDYMWMPPSTKAVGVYLYTDNVGAYWDAPAGLNRGHLTDTLDVAFNPTNEEAGQIYIHSWNYAISYPLDGIVVEGQRTFQRNKTALDRVNVRRLMLGMEKVVRNFCKYFNYEGNTHYTRQRMKDIIDQYLEQVKINYGISQYITVCDDTNNTPQTIDNNELHIDIAVRPVKTIEFIVLNFYATNQSVDVSEVIGT